jgi:hypothetical protein
MTAALVDDVDGKRTTSDRWGQEVPEQVVAALRVVVRQGEVQRAVAVEVDPLNTVAGIVIAHERRRTSCKGPLSWLWKR